MKNKFAVVLFTIGILVFALGAIATVLITKQLDPKLYQTALDESGFYQYLNEQLDQSLVKSLKQPELENFSSLTENLKLNKDINEIIKDIIDTNISRFITYISNDDPELIVYFPLQKITDYINNPDNIDAVIKDVRKQYLSLPYCSVTDILKALSNQCRIQLNPADEKVLLDRLENQIKVAIKEQLNINTFLKDNNLQGFNEQTPVSQALKNAPTETRTNVLNFLQNFKTIFQAVRIASLILLILGISLIILSFVLQKPTFHEALLRFTFGLLIVAILFIVNAIVGLSLPKAILSQVQGTSTDQASTIFINFVNSVTNQLFTPSLQIGIVLLILACILFIPMIALQINSKPEVA